MKYLKLMESYHIRLYEELIRGDYVKNIISSHVNYDMINDIKDMSLEYLDEGYLLSINGLYKIDFSNEDTLRDYNKYYHIEHWHRQLEIGYLSIFYMKYYHTKDEERWNIFDDFWEPYFNKINDDDIYYHVQLNKYISYDDINNELIERVTDAYPNVHILAKYPKNQICSSYTLR